MPCGPARPLTWSPLTPFIPCAGACWNWDSCAAHGSTVVRRAPMGDPVELRVGGTDLALRASDLLGIRVRE